MKQVFHWLIASTLILASSPQIEADTRAQMDDYANQILLSSIKTWKSDELIVRVSMVTHQYRIAFDAIKWTQKRLQKTEIAKELQVLSSAYETYIPLIISFHLSPQNKNGSFTLPEDLKDYLFLENDTGDFVRPTEVDLPFIRILNILNEDATLSVLFPSKLPNDRPLITSKTRNITLTVSVVSSREDAKFKWNVPISLPSKPPNDMERIFRSVEFGPLYRMDTSLSSIDHSSPDTTGKPRREEGVALWDVEDKPRILKSAAPVYPESARKSGLEGSVFLKFMVGKDGRVKQVQVLKGQEAFRQAAIDAIMQWVFKPAMQKGKPVNVWMTQPIQFKLHD